MSLVKHLARRVGDDPIGCTLMSLIGTLWWMSRYVVLELVRLVLTTKISPPTYHSIPPTAPIPRTVVKNSTRFPPTTPDNYDIVVNRISSADRSALEDKAIPWTSVVVAEDVVLSGPVSDECFSVVSGISNV